MFVVRVMTNIVRFNSSEFYRPLYLTPAEVIPVGTTDVANVVV